MNLLITLVLVALWVCSAEPVAAQNIESRNYDWIIEIKTAEIRKYLDYPGSPLKPFIQASVTYREQSNDGKPKKPIKYEDLFYRGCDPVGCRRIDRLNIQPGDGVAIRVVHATRAEGPEMCAAANAIIRVLLDSYLNGNPVIAVLVPNASFDTIVNDLHRERFYPAGPDRPDEPEFSSIVLHLQGEPGGNSQTLNYAGQTTD